MAKHKNEKLLLKEPVYPGGQKAMLLFIQNNLQYPAEAIAANMEGTVRIRFSIDHTGKVFKSQVLVSLGHGCDEEAVRLVSLLRFEVPKAYGLKVQFHKTLNIHFKLHISPEEPSSLPGPLSIQYTISASSERGQKETIVESPANSYHYTIQINH